MYHKESKATYPKGCKSNQTSQSSHLFDEGQRKRCSLSKHIGSTTETGLFLFQGGRSGLSKGAKEPCKELSCKNLLTQHHVSISLSVGNVETKVMPLSANKSIGDQSVLMEGRWSY